MDFEQNQRFMVTQKSDFNQHNFMLKWSFWCFMKLRPRTLHFWSVFVFTTNHMVLSTINPMKTPVFWSWFWLAFWVSFWGSSIRFTDGKTMWLVVNTKTLQKWRVRGLSYIKHQKLLKISTWAWSYVDLKKCHFFLTKIFGFCVDLRSDNDIHVIVRS